ncbi:hypothetical protein NPIL_513611, partial [Nephila pilipes]
MITEGQENSIIPTSMGHKDFSEKKKNPEETTVNMRKNSLFGR